MKNFSDLLDRGSSSRWSRQDPSGAIGTSGSGGGTFLTGDEQQRLQRSLVDVAGNTIACLNDVGVPENVAHDIVSKAYQQR